MLDRDSAHFAQASKQMVETGDYWAINFQDSPRHLKPPGIYWLQAFAVNAFSPQDLTQVWPYRISFVVWCTIKCIISFWSF